MKTYGNKHVSIGIISHGKLQVSIIALIGGHQYHHQGEVEFVYKNSFGVNIKFVGQEGVAFIGKLPMCEFMAICHELATLKCKSLVYDGKGRVTFK